VRRPGGGAGARSAACVCAAEALTAVRVGGRARGRHRVAGGGRLVGGRRGRPLLRPLCGRPRPRWPRRGRAVRAVRAATGSSTQRRGARARCPPAPRAGGGKRRPRSTSSMGRASMVSDAASGGRT
jgi:hypothetical protein